MNRTRKVLKRFKGWRPNPFARRQAHDTEFDTPLRCGSPDQSSINKVEMTKRNKKIKVTLPNLGGLKW